MIEITVRMLPKGRRENSRIMGRMYIHNDASGTLLRGNYVARVYSGEHSTKPFRTGTVQGFPRKSKSVWHLMLWALKLLYEVSDVKQPQR